MWCNLQQRDCRRSDCNSYRSCALVEERQGISEAGDLIARQFLIRRKDESDAVYECRTKTGRHAPGGQS